MFRRTGGAGGRAQERRGYRSPTMTAAPLDRMIPPSLTPSATPRTLPKASAAASHWRFDPSIVFLNHGSFGGVPAVVSEHQRMIQLLLQREPVRFFVELMEPMLDRARAAVAALAGCSADDMAFVLNATMGVNAIVRSLRFEPGDELLTSTHEYNACNNVLDWAAERWGAKVVRAEPPFPVRSSDEMYEAITAAVTPRTRLLLVSHITSPTGIILPVERLVAEMNRRGVDTLVDGAHAPGMVPLNLDTLNAPFYTGNLHKWCCAPSGAAFVHVRRDRQHQVRPAVISHGANAARTDRSRFRLEFDYIGTADPSAWLSVPSALSFVPSILGPSGRPSESPEDLRAGWERVMRRNHELVLKGRDILCRGLGVEPPAPDDMLGSLATVPLVPASASGAPRDPTGPEHPSPARTTRYHDELQERLIVRHAVQVPIVAFPADRRQVRISAHLHNSEEQYEYLLTALKAELTADR